MSQATEANAPPEFDLADRLRKTLRESGIGVAEMADYLGVSRSAVSNWINGHIVPTGPSLRLWALRCGVSVDWLMSGASCTHNWVYDSETATSVTHRCSKCGDTNTRPKGQQ